MLLAFLKNVLIQIKNLKDFPKVKIYEEIYKNLYIEILKNYVKNSKKNYRFKSD